MTIPLIWLGLLLSIFHVFTSPIAAILGASIGYALLWIIAKLYYYIRHQEGMGYGDFKMLAVIGAWIGFNAILNTLIIATILGLIVGILQICIKRANLKSALPFGPFLAIGGWITLLFGPITINWIIQQVQ